MLEESGLSPYDTLLTATSHPAAFLNKPREFGTVVVGARADLLLLRGNPLDDLNYLDKPVGVMVRGRWLPAHDLDSMVNKLCEH